MFNAPRKLGIRPISPQIDVLHGTNDPGMLNEAAQYLRKDANLYDYALVLFDREGCGREELPAEELESLVQERLDANGWKERSAVIVIDPELEEWVWSDSPHVPTVIGLERDTLASVLNNYPKSENGKPRPPKIALETALKRTRRPRSSDIYKELAGKVSYTRCKDGAFQRLLSVLRSWFPPEPKG